MIEPDNFLYFITLFSAAIFGGTYLLFAYYLNRLLLLNTLLFFIVAARIASEYYMQQIETFEGVEAYTDWQVLLAHLAIPIQWILVWTYVRPLKNWKWERLANYFVIWGLIIIPFISHHYFTVIDHSVFYFAPERIDGFWQFAIDTDFWYYSYYRNHTDWSLLVLVIGTLVVGIVRNPVKRLRQSFLLMTYFVMPIIYYGILMKQGTWNVPVTGILYLLHTLIISWYVSNYRLFKSNINAITKDLFDSISDLTISTDSNLKITSYNTKTAATFNVGEKTKDIVSLLEQHSESGKQGIDISVKNLLSDVSGGKELEMKDKTGETRILRLRVAPFKVGEKLFGYTFLLTDLTEILAKEKELAALNTTKDRLFAIIGHDLRKPALAFRGIGRKIDYLIKKNDHPQLAAFSQSLEEAAMSLNSLLDNILNWAMKERGMNTYRPRTIQLFEVVQELVTMFQPLANRKEVVLAFNMPEEALLFTDPNAFKTILRNLLDNAIKFTPQNGRVEIGAKITTGTTTLIITDTGTGMTKEALLSIFELSQAESSRGTAGEKGTGLGLHIVQELVAQNMGKIEVESLLGQGTRFRITFPNVK